MNAFDPIDPKQFKFTPKPDLARRLLEAKLQPVPGKSGFALRDDGTLSYSPVGRGTGVQPSDRKAVTFADIGDGALKDAQVQGRLHRPDVKRSAVVEVTGIWLGDGQMRDYLDSSGPKPDKPGLYIVSMQNPKANVMSTAFALKLWFDGEFWYGNGIGPESFGQPGKRASQGWAWLSEPVQTAMKLEGGGWLVRDDAAHTLTHHGVATPDLLVFLARFSVFFAGLFTLVNVIARHITG
jgi:hypothetical protein